VELASLASDLGYEFADMPGNLLIHYLRRSAILMCQQGDLAPQERLIQTVPGIEAYPLEPDEETEIWAILGVRSVANQWPENVLTPGFEPDDFWLGAMTHFWFEPPATVHFRRDPGWQSHGRYKVIFSATPTRDACEIDAVIGDNYYDTLINGARWLIHEVSGKPWSEPNLANMYRQKFYSALQANKAHELTGRQRGFLKLAHRRIL
jgi:hypothetical protein